MAFGKNENDKLALQGLQGTFSQRAAHRRKQEMTRGDGGGKGPPYWMGNFRPSEMPDTIRCIPGSYTVQEIDGANGELMDVQLEFFPFIEHYHGGLKKGAICSAGPHHGNRQKRSPCLGCDVFWEDFETRKQRSAELGVKVNTPKRVSKSNKYAITVLDTGTFYETESVDSRTGQVRVGSNGKPFMEWVKLRYANDPAAQGKKMKQGAVMPWVLNSTEFDLLQAYSEKNIGTCCSGCGTWGHQMNPTLVTLQHICQHCNHVLIDVQTSTTPPNQIAEIIKAPIQCKNCGNRNFALEVVHCPTCAQRGTQPKRATLWDVDIQVQLVPSAKDPTKHDLMINGYTAPQAIGAQFADIAKPLDLVKKFCPTPIAQQASLWNLHVPAEHQIQHAAPYSQT